MPAKPPIITAIVADQLIALGLQIRAHRKALRVSVTTAAEAAGWWWNGHCASFWRVSRVSRHRLFVLDLAMMQPRLFLLSQAIAKADGAYGQSIRVDLEKAIHRLQHRQGWLERCMQAMAMTLPKALVWQRVRNLRKALFASEPDPTAH